MAFQVPSNTKKGKFYTIDDNGNCNCPGYYFKHTCSHIKLAESLGLLNPTITTADLLSQVEPSAVSCLVCNKPLQSIVEVPSLRHGRCILKEIFHAA